ncbi:hypothetical protein H696_03633 [Fonticula alba]|uniref:Uncharacterized protein n=1 Tax=Fonticula alba TaxID=691883 RepID=A0A058Z7A0_FONAL|nr:hypothetical protein H696_03633 [Fonticula alba]KCV70174.1 hypothetical protein H696_03633 [Fonticula alba]|eukprot:XP_009495780.1 hypothetical protein H696_03633 [Fonticula alba]
MPMVSMAASAHTDSSPTPTSNPSFALLSQAVARFEESGVALAEEYSRFVVQSRAEAVTATSLGASVATLLAVRESREVAQISHQLNTPEGPR